MLCSECTQPVYELAETNTLDSGESCVEISTRHSWLWPEICLQCRHEIAGICQCRLGREHDRLKENIRLLFYFGVYHSFLVQPETDLFGFEYRRSILHYIMCGSLPRSVASEAPCRLIWS
jgi:hypothetical protein